ncbi:hypothetical protein [Pleionea sediminis]|uniref:hypothetical protein n=1 Tax=Pleionea sediminis TaxID=2569479 RepID=UPI0011867F2F|nr:hypothetical protein [Pleionea sediminis]
MTTSEVLAYFKDFLILAMVIAIFINRKNRPLLVLSFAVLVHHIIGLLVYDFIYNLGSSKTTWNLSWVVLELPFFAFIYGKIIFSNQYKKIGLGGECKRDLDVLILSFLYVSAHAIEFADWNSTNSFMMQAMLYITPTINCLIVAAILTDSFKNTLDKLFKRINKVVNSYNSKVDNKHRVIR